MTNLDVAKLFYLNWYLSTTWGEVNSNFSDFLDYCLTEDENHQLMDWIEHKHPLLD